MCVDEAKNDKPFNLRYSLQYHKLCIETITNVIQLYPLIRNIYKGHLNVNCANLSIDGILMHSFCTKKLCLNIEFKFCLTQYFVISTSRFLFTLLIQFRYRVAITHFNFLFIHPEPFEFNGCLNFMLWKCWSLPSKTSMVESFSSTILGFSMSFSKTCASNLQRTS